MKRRTLLKAAAQTSLVALTPKFAFGQAPTKVKVGYLHTLAVDGQMWLAEAMGLWRSHGLEMEYVQFQTGLEMFQAMTGGSIDVLSTGAVISNFPARGQGKVFLVNDVEFATAQLWVRPDMGIKTLADLKGRKISTTTGTTAHVFLDSVLRANHLAPGDVEIVNQRMPDAVTAFISGAVPAVALWVPFDIAVKQKVPGAIKLVDASAYYPQAAIVDGWAASNDFYDKNRSTLGRIVSAWSVANDAILKDPQTSLALLQSQHYPNVSLSDLTEQFKDEKAFTSSQWRTYYADGTVTKWMQNVTDFFGRIGHIENAVPASQYFDTSIFLQNVKA